LPRAGARRPHGRAGTIRHTETPPAGELRFHRGRSNASSVAEKKEVREARVAHAEAEKNAGGEIIACGRGDRSHSARQSQKARQQIIENADTESKATTDTGAGGSSDAQAS
jgi:hypothetical protein